MIEISSKVVGIDRKLYVRRLSENAESKPSVKKS